MNFRLLASLMVAGTTCSLASADVVSTVNPKTTQRTADRAQLVKAQQAQRALQFKLASAGQTPPTVGGGMQNPNPTGSGGSLAVGGSDSCSTPDLIAGVGSFAFDNSLATTGAEGQTEAACLAFGTTGVTNDVWFAWTSPSTGTATMSLCGQTGMDSKIAAYAGGACPTAGSALACNDDTCGLQSNITFPATAGAVYMLQLGNYPGATGSTGTFSLSVSAGPGGNDDCSGATVIAGVGTFPFDSTGASTGPQQGLACGQGTAFADVWYSWVAPTTGTCVFTLCNGGAGFDTLIAAYSNAGCPGAGTALTCNDDSCGLISSTSFPVVAGQNYMLQIGSYSGGNGPGAFDLSVLPPPGACTPLDDGTTENLLGWTAGGDMVWVNRFGVVGQQSTIGSIDVAWGSAMFPGYSSGNGSATHIFVYQDGVSQDGDPTDATLLLTINTTVSANDTDTYVNYPIAPLSITGYFFVGSNLPHNAGQYVAPMDQTAHVVPNVSWFFGDNTSQLANYANPGLNIQPPFTFDSIGLPAQTLVRVNCSTGPATFLCDPGSGGVIACPCANPPSGSGRGCDNSSATGGASISAAGSNALATPTLSFTTAGEKPTATTILLQGGANLAAGVTFGQGVRCVGGVLKRLYVKTAVGGSITAPDFGVGDLDIPARSAVLGDLISAGQTRWYMAYYRDPIVLGGCSALSTFNATNAAEVQWQ
jgi:hypothetical protein